MNLRDYREMPDEGLFEKIEHRVRMRRIARMGGVVAAVAVVALVAGIIVSHTLSPTGNAVEVAVVDVPSVTTAVIPVLQPSTDAPQTVVPQGRPVATEIQTPVAEVTPMPISETSGVTVPGKQPVLPPAAVMPETTPVAELILTESEIDDVVDMVTRPSKSEEPTATPPHYDNILWAPNVIIPADNDPVNHVFKVKSTSTVSDFRMVIYNRGGRQVFSSGDINQGWDATRDGSMVPQGTYVWVARFRDSDGVLRQEKGTVTVVR